MAPFDIRIVGDPVLKQRAHEIENVDDALVRLVDDMVVTMYEAPGVGLAAPQVGVQKRLFVYDIGEGPQTLVNPTIVEGDGEWVYDEGCLSVPGLSWEIVRPKEVHLTGWDLDGNEVSFEADEFLARVFQHEMDHLDGILLLERLDEDQAKEAKKLVRELMLTGRSPSGRRTPVPAGDSPGRACPWPEAGARAPRASGVPGDPRDGGPLPAGAARRRVAHRPRRLAARHPASPQRRSRSPAR